MVNLAGPVLASLALTSAMLTSAFYKKKQFYPTVVHLTKNKLCLSIAIVYIVVAKMLCRLFFGRLLRNEVDNVLTRYWFSFVDMCLIFASFQEELSLSFLFSFMVLMLVKGFHWLLEERVEYMERTPVISRTFHIRTCSLVFILAAVDMYYVKTVSWKPMYPGEAIHIATGVEYFSLLFTLVSVVVRYVLHTIEARREHPWDRKAMYLLITDVLVGICRLTLYVDLMLLMWRNYPFPLFLIRPIYLSLRFLKKSLRDVILSRRAINYMNTVFKNASRDDLETATDRTCIICREEMHSTDASDSSRVPSQHGTVKRLPCTHMFHETCLRSWFQRQQTCPTCRMDVIAQARQQSRLQQQRGAGSPSRPEPAAANSSQNAAASSSSSPAASSASPSSPSSSSATSYANNQPPNFSNCAEWTRLFQNLTQPAQQSQAGDGAAGARQGPLPLFPVPPMPMLGTGASPFMLPIVIPGNLFPHVSRPMPQPPGDASDSFLSESALRDSVDARMAALRQVQTLLDAAVLQMNAYVAATADQSNDKHDEQDQATKAATN